MGSGRAETLAQLQPDRVARTAAIARGSMPQSKGALRARIGVNGVRVAVNGWLVPDISFGGSISKDPVKRAVAVPREIDADRVEVVEPFATRGAWFSFPYAHTEISATGNTARVRSTRASLRDGKLTIESFEGELDRSAYERTIDDTQRLFVVQTSLWLRMLGALPPRAAARDRD